MMLMCLSHVLNESILLFIVNLFMITFINYVAL